MSTQSSAVYQEIQQILGNYSCGVPYSCLSWLETSYIREFRRFVEYVSLDVQNINGLVATMLDEGILMLSEDPETKKKYVMSARMVKYRRLELKLKVKKLLLKYSGKIPLNYFERLYKHNFMVKVNYLFYGLTGLDHLCEVLNLVVETDSGGERVIKEMYAYALRKRKRNE